MKKILIIKNCRECCWLVEGKCLKTDSYYISGAGFMKNCPLEELLQPDVTESGCDNCESVSGFYLGMTCPKCNRPFRNVKQTVR